MSPPPYHFFADSSKLVQYVLLFSFLLLLLPTRTLAQSSGGARNSTIPIDSPQIIYTPFICNRNMTISTPNTCNGGWVTKLVNGQPSISTTGPDSATGQIIPQMFFQFRASALYMFTSRTSNALANITITFNQTTVSATFDSSLGFASILNLSPSLITTFALTFLPNDTPREFVLTALNVTIPDGGLTTTLPILPTMTLPPSSSPPILSPTFSRSRPYQTAATTATAEPISASSARHANTALAVGVTLGLGLGLTSVTAAGYWWYKRRRRRRWTRSLVDGSRYLNSGAGNAGGGGSGGSGTSAWRKRFLR